MRRGRNLQYAVTPSMMGPTEALLGTSWIAYLGNKDARSTGTTRTFWCLHSKIHASQSLVSKIWPL